MSAKSRTRSEAFTFRPAVSSDLPQLQSLLARGEYVYAHLDWWPLEEWLGSPACVVAMLDGAVAGLSLAARDGSTVAWWRGLALSEARDPLPFLRAMLPPVLAGLRQLGATALTCMGFAHWLESALPELGFSRLTQVITLRKDSRRAPPLSAGTVSIRAAVPADLPGILAVDHAAFDLTWRYGARGLALMWNKMAHIAVAEQGGRVIGYACGNVNDWSGHVVRLAVHPEHQGRGTGAKLLAEMARAFYTAGAQAVTLNTQIDNTASQKLYRQFDFYPIGYAVGVWQRPV